MIKNEEGTRVTASRVLKEEEIHEILSNGRRRWTIEHLKDENRQVTLRGLSEWIAEVESGESPPPTDARQSVYNSLHQTHLPKLDRLDIVDYDRNRKTVSLGEKARTVDLYMEVLTPYGITWSTYYRTLLTLGLTAILIDQLGVFVFTGDYSVLIASFFLVLVAVSTLYQLWSNRWIHLSGIFATK